MKLAANKKYRIGLKQQMSRGHYSVSFIDINNLEDLINKLSEDDIYQITFKYNSHFSEGESFHSDSMKTEEMTQPLFDWVTDKVEGSYKFIEIYKRKKK